MTDPRFVYGHEDTLHLASYELGVEHGISIGREQAEDEWRARQAVSAAVARHIAEAGSLVDLCERRGERDRAERQRSILRERGVSA